MSLDLKQVEHIGELAKLGLTDKDKKKFQKELSSILAFVEKLNEVKTDQVEPMGQVVGLRNITRQDNARKGQLDKTSKLLGQAPEIKNNQIKVKAIL